VPLLALLLVLFFFLLFVSLSLSVSLFLSFPFLVRSPAFFMRCVCCLSNC